MHANRPIGTDPAARLPMANGRWRRAALAAAVLLIGLGAATADAAPRRLEIRRATEQILTGGDFQQAHPRALPAPDLAEGSQTPSGGGAYGRPGGLPAGLSGLGRMLLWMLALVGAGLVIAFALSELSSLTRSVKGTKGEARDGPRLPANGEAGRPAAGTLADAERLAGMGRYGEAIHALLLACLEELRRRFDPGQPSSLTSREIARRLAMSEGAGTALAAIVTAAELSHFGGRRPGASDYRSCLESYRAISAEPGAAP